MAKYYYSNDCLHCSQERCPKYKDCWRAELGRMLAERAKHDEFAIASFYMPSEDKDLSNCEYFVDKEEYKL